SHLPHALPPFPTRRPSDLYLLPRSEGGGLILATELMTTNSGIEACIRDRRLSQIPGLIQIGHGDGMHTVDDSLIELLIAERINIDRKSTRLNSSHERTRYA